MPVLKQGGKKDIKKVHSISSSCLFLIPDIGKAQSFDFHGVEFGMERTEVEKVFKIRV